MALEKEHPGADGADGVRSFWSRIAFRLFRKSRYRMSASQREADTADGLLGEREVTKESSTASAASAGYDMQTRVYSRRWAILVLFTAYSMSSAYQWIHVNIVFDVAKTYYNASLPESDRMKNLAIDFLSMAYMIAYIPLIFPANWLLDTKGLRVIGLLGSFLNALGAWLKCAAVSPDRFWLLMLAQTVCAIAQVFILGIPARLAAVWFGPNQVSTATAIGVFGNQLGVALGFVLPPYIVIKDDNLDVVGERFSYLFYGGAALTTVLFILVIFGGCCHVAS